jgi:hypothetical protein
MASFFNQLFANSPVVEELRNWGSTLGQHAILKWSGALMGGFKCSFHGSCRRSAIGPCVACQKPICLEHAFISIDAIPICFECVKNIAPQAQARPQQPPGPSSNASAAEQRKADLKTLGLREDASLEDIRAAFKKLAAKCHPDRVRDPVKRAVAERKFKEINAAFQRLSK